MSHPIYRKVRRKWKNKEDANMNNQTTQTAIWTKADQEAAWAAIRARNDADAIELNKIPAEERQRIVEANYYGRD